MAAPDLVTIVLPNGGRYVVARPYQDQFLGLITDLNQGGYQVDPAHSHGYRPLAPGETMVTNPHAGGRAIDINANRNPMGAGQPTDIPPDLARALAARWGFQWGGDFRTTPRDPMHFQVAGTPGVNTGTGTLGVANANMPTPPVSPPGGPSPTVGPETNPASMQQAPAPQNTPIDPLLAAAAFNGGTGIAGGPGSLSDAFARAVQAGPLNRPITYPS